MPENADITEQQQLGLAHLRQRIFECAKAENVELTESVKWGQASFKAPNGSPVRIGLPKDGGFALFASCSTTLIADYAGVFPGRFDGNRGVLFESVAEAKDQPLEILLAAAFRYHEKT